MVHISRAPNVGATSQARSLGQGDFGERVLPTGEDNAAQTLGSLATYGFAVEPQWLLWGWEMARKEVL